VDIKLLSSNFLATTIAVINLINGFGLVRYISDDKAGVDDEIDMNVPNIYPKNGEDGKDVSQKNVQAEDLTTTKSNNCC